LAGMDEVVAVLENPASAVADVRDAMRAARAAYFCDDGDGDDGGGRVDGDVDQVVDSAAAASAGRVEAADQVKSPDAAAPSAPASDTPRQPRFRLPGGSRGGLTAAAAAADRRAVARYLWCLLNTCTQHWLPLLPAADRTRLFTGCLRARAQALPTFLALAQFVAAIKGGGSGDGVAAGGRAAAAASAGARREIHPGYAVAARELDAHRRLVGVAGCLEWAAGRTTGGADSEDARRDAEARRAEWRAYCGAVVALPDRVAPLPNEWFEFGVG
ncbi:hypothetical protein HK405_001682, partial [Cladochytrium tenue]